jgi:uncharacterized protein with PQ loop repeat
MFAQILGVAATAYGVLGALKALLQTRQMLARRSSRDVSAGFLASYVGGYAIWLAYGLSAGSIPLIVVDSVGLLSGGLTLAVALFLRAAGRSRSSRPPTAVSVLQEPKDGSPAPCADQPHTPSSEAVSGRSTAPGRALS